MRRRAHAAHRPNAMWQAWRQTARLGGSHRKLWVPFLVVAALQLLFLGLVWLAPHPPFSTVLAPPIQYLVGDRFLHYPWHVWFLYHTMTHAYLASSILLGAFMSGIVCAMVRQTHDGRSLSVRDALVSGDVRYGTVVVLWIVAWVVARGVTTALIRFAPKGSWTLCGVIGVTVSLQVLFAYAIPAAVFERTTWPRALWLALRETARYPVSTVLTVAIPSAAVVFWSVAVPEGRVAQWMIQTTPEIVAAFIAGRFFAWLAADAMLTVGVAHLWWAHRVPQRTPHQAVASASSSFSPRPVSLLAGVLAVIAIAVSLPGCSSSYNGERLFWKAQQLHHAVLKNPSQATDEQVQTIIAAFARVIHQTPGTIWAARAQVAIGSLYALRHEYDRARTAFATVLQEYHDSTDLCLESRLAIAKTYEAEQRWDEAVTAYHDIADFHPWTQLGMEAPLYVAASYEKRGQAAQAAQAYLSAAHTYVTRIPNAPTPELETEVKSYLALAYQRMGDWENAAKTLENLAQVQTGVNRPLILMTLASIYQAKLDDQAKAKELYQKVLSEFPTHPFGSIAKVKLEHLGLDILPQPDPTPAAPSP